ncbi:MAG: FtsX-like permease family protein [Acidobacteria bacterium]|nr:FtsX-like permease family protein [Acidobacteriota bacterium]
MSCWTILKIAWRALARNKMRSSLTLLGMVIGVGAVITMVSLGQAAQRMVEQQIASVGPNLLFVTPGSRNTGGVQMGAGASATLTDSDVDAIVREVPLVAAATPMVTTRGQMIFGNQNWASRVEGTNERAPEIRAWGLQRGEFFTGADVRSASRVVVLGHTVADRLFEGVDPIGQTLRLNNLPFRVTGVLEAKGQALTGQDQDDMVVVPYTTVQKKLKRTALAVIDNAMISTISPLASRVAEAQITELMRQRHNIHAGDPDDFRVRNLADVAQAAEQTTLILTLLLGSIAAVSLIVGGIGIMNIMLVSVTERTREIGIRMAVGARASQIRLQFLAESVMLSLVGGLIGIVLGSAGAAGIAHALKWPTFISLLAVVVAFVFSAAVGIFFGYYPAHRAASLDPIEALRYE